MIQKPRKEIHIEFGKIDYRTPGRKSNLVEVDYQWNGEDFSVSASIWNQPHTDILRGGQCLDAINEYRDKLNNPELWDEIYDLWQHWHLDTLSAGTPEQMKAEEDWKAETGNKSWNFDYDGLIEYLKKRNSYEVLDPENPGKMFAFGSRWLTWRVPDDVKKRMDRIMEEYGNESR